MKHVQRGTALLAVSAALTVLTACAVGEDVYSDLEQPPSTHEEPLPATLPAYALEGSDTDTVRWVGASSDVDVYLARAVDSGACLLAYAGEDDWASTCLDPAGSLSLGGDLTFTVRPDGAPVPDGSTPLSHNVFVSDVPR